MNPRELIVSTAQQAWRNQGVLRGRAISALHCPRKRALRQRSQLRQVLLYLSSLDTLLRLHWHR